MAKMIKFDLLLNGNKVKNLEELQDNFTFDIIRIARSGRLVKWLLSRDENELANNVKATEKLIEDLELFKALASIFEIEYDEESLQELYDEFQSFEKGTIALSVNSTDSNEDEDEDEDEDDRISKFQITSFIMVKALENDQYIINCDLMVKTALKIQANDNNEIKSKSITPSLLEKKYSEVLSFISKHRKLEALIEEKQLHALNALMEILDQIEDEAVLTHLHSLMMSTYAMMDLPRKDSTCLSELTQATSEMERIEAEIRQL